MLPQCQEDTCEWQDVETEPEFAEFSESYASFRKNSDVSIQECQSHLNWEVNFSLQFQVSSGPIAIHTYSLETSREYLFCYLVVCINTSISIQYPVHLHPASCSYIYQNKSINVTFIFFWLQEMTVWFLKGVSPFVNYSNSPEDPSKKKTFWYKSTI